ncbi:Acyl-coenzyme A synthetase/AMP-(fatty) acid ligase [Cupriavidus necator]|uniref:2-Aminobenzoate-CoA ligase n=1 Tax=Cupriavidus necator (strain ATCC 17699 / DSM 428 / KCTC 22496 / NCIMB 10442 / H16 / Stanier 337) TaxID=381666 RepID=Q0K8X5_CUPNH|nr:AMP-binding protein [Cupriavidus necator]QCC01344.1 2-aminobenzoate-CoA ligase [Cupriavidus necator H16]QQB75828.1 AMP-binding protein [Cupriavidus necator]WKA39731.1 AMP-binding protein [Cupriavidus necator]CAJ93546.1 2-Aminobenzoate-CoA ligase [Cupriavidus necator H16]
MATTAHLDTFARDRLPPPDMWPVFRFNADTDYPERMNAAVELVDRHVREGRGERIAIRHRRDGQIEAVTYAQLAALVNRIAHVLVEDMQLVPGNRVLLRGPNNLMMAASWLATLKAGLVAVPTMPLLRAKELKQIIDKAQVGAALCDARLREELDANQQAGGEFHCPSLARTLYFNGEGEGSLEAAMAGKPDAFEACDTASDDVCLIAFTSGTTGQPKGTMHFHRDVLAMCDLFPRHVLRPQPDDVFCGTPPIAFTFGLGGMLCFPLRIGASAVLAEKLTPETLLGLIQDFRATIVFTAPTFYRQMAALAPRYDLSSLKKSVSAGEALPDATRQSWKAATGIEMTDGIGGTEMMHIFISSAGAEVRPGAIGRVVPGYVAQIVDENMQPLPPGQVGKLAVQGPTGCRYLDDPRQSNYVKAGWNLPGDTFFVDEDGYYFYQARSDDMIISAGYNIAGPEVESALMQHEAVAECGVVGAPDDGRGQVVMAYVVLREGVAADDATRTALQDYVKRQIAPYKYPRRIVFVPALPRTETGKLQRFRLRQMAEQGNGGGNGGVNQAGKP